MVHTATLVHDDVLDEASVRRHLATVNARWDNEASVLLGDFLFSRAFHLASTLDSPLACQWIGRSTNVVCEGEIRQKGSRGDASLDEATYLEILDAKTAELCACCCQLGAHYAGASEPLTRRLTMFGRHLGVAFQIADDLLDVVGTETAAGKSLGTDLEKQKPTLPLIRALQIASEVERQEMLAALQGEPGSSLDRLRVLFRAAGCADLHPQQGDRLCPAGAGRAVGIARQSGRPVASPDGGVCGPAFLLRSSGPPHLTLQVARTRFAILQDRLQFVHEIVHVLEVAIDAGEPHIGDLVEIFEVFHDQFAQRARFDFGLEIGIDVAFDIGHQAIDLFVADRPLPAGAFQPAADLVAEKRLPAPVLLDDFNRHFIRAFVRGVTASALQAVPPTANGEAVVGYSGIDHSVIVFSTKWASHAIETSKRNVVAGRWSGPDGLPRLASRVALVSLQRHRKPATISTRSPAGSHHYTRSGPPATRAFRSARRASWPAGRI